MRLRESSVAVLGAAAGLAVVLAACGAAIAPLSPSEGTTDPAETDVSSTEVSTSATEDVTTTESPATTPPQADAETTAVTETTEPASTMASETTATASTDISTTDAPAASVAAPTTDAANPSGCVALGTEQVATDRADYAPGETVHVTGSGYAASCIVRVEVTRPDGSVVKGDGSFTPGVDEVVTTAGGTFSYLYRLNGIEGLYRIRVLGEGDVVLATTTFTDQLRATPSDPRAEFHLGNATTCADVDFPDSIQVGAAENNPASDPNVAGTVSPNSGSIQPGQGEEVNVTIIPPGTGVVIDAVMVKGGNGYNVYLDPDFLPPTLPPPQHYISPLNGPTGSTGQVPDVSHWFICYHLATPPPAGSLTVHKAVIPPHGIPATPLPTSFTVFVNCGDGVDIPVSFGVGGGRSFGNQTITGIPVGSVCTVVEQNTESFPPGSVVTYDPPGAATDGVTIPEGEAGVTVTVTNDFSGVEVLTASLQVEKVVVPTDPAVTPPESFTAHVSCEDGTEEDVVLPGAGGEGTPTVAVTAGTLCLVEELTASLPPGWTVTYSVDGGPPSAEPPVFRVPSTETVAVTITNDPPDVTTTTTTVAPSTTAPPTSGPSTSSAAGGGSTSTTAASSGGAGGTTTTTLAPGFLPVTGARDVFAVAALIVLALGAVLTLLARRPTSS